MMKTGKTNDSLVQRVRAVNFVGIRFFVFKQWIELKTMVVAVIPEMGVEKNVIKDAHTQIHVSFSIDRTRMSLSYCFHVERERKKK